MNCCSCCVVRNHGVNFCLGIIFPTLTSQNCLSSLLPPSPKRLFETVLITKVLISRKEFYYSFETGAACLMDVEDMCKLGVNRNGELGIFNFFNLEV